MRLRLSISHIDRVKKKYDNLKKMWADMGYQGENLQNEIKEEYNIELEIVKRPRCRFWVPKDTPLDQLPNIEPGFKIQPRRWVVERTFAWLGRNRKLSKEYDLLSSSTENIIYLAMSKLLLNRITCAT